MKKLLVVVVILGAIFGLSPYFIGQQAEQKIRDIYGQMNTTPEFVFEVTEYNRGWFSSTATIELKLDMGQIDPTMTDQMVFKMHNELEHGPILTTTSGMELGLGDFNTTLELPEFITKELPELNDALKDIFVIKSRMYFDGGSSGVSTMKAFDFTKEGVTIDVKEANMTASTTSDGKMVVDGTWGGMSVSDSNTFGVTLGKTDFDFDLKAIDGNIYDINAIYTGDSSISMDEFRLSGAEIPGNVALTAITATSSTTMDNDLMALDLNMGIGKIDAMGLSFSDFVFDQMFANLDVPSLRKLNELNRSINEQNLETKMEELKDVGLAMLAKKPEYMIKKLGVTTAQGEISSEATVKINEEKFDINNPDSILLAIEADGSGYIPEPFLNAMGMGPMVAPFVEQGYLKKDGDNLVFEMSFKNGMPTLFGKPIPMGPPAQ